MGNKRKSNASGTVEAALTAILAALLWREDFKAGRTAEAIRRAHKLIESVPDYLSGKKTSPGQSLEDAFQVLNVETDRQMEEAEEWGLAEYWSPEFFQKYDKLPKGVFTFDQAIAQGICHSHKTLKGLEKLLRSVGYPKDFLRDRVIAKVGYEQAVQEQKAARRAADRERKKRQRARKRVPKSSGKQT